MHVHLALIVGRAAGIEIAIADGGLEGRCFPEFDWIGRLDVEVAVAQHGGLAFGVQPVGVDQGMPVGFDEFDVLHAGIAQLGDDVFGSAAYVLFVFGIGADTGDADELFQFLEETIAVLFDELFGFGRHELLL